MPLIQSKQESVTDRGENTATTNTSTSTPPISPVSNKFGLDWFSFDGKSSTPKSPLFRPESPSGKLRSLSVSTASPSDYFSESSLVSETAGRPTSDWDTSASIQVVYPPIPPRPLRWIWQCHLCHSRYPLAVTRRCLVDGHYYCSGNSQNQRNVKKRRKQQSCTSEFDYIAWKEWGQWRRKTLALRAFVNGKGEPRLLGCDGCGSPSQCRYEQRGRVEIIKFDDFIQQEDLMLGELDRPVLMSSRRILGLSSPLLVQRQRSHNAESIAVKKNLRTELSPTSSLLDTRSSKRSRFYSNLMGNLSTRDLSSTSESLDRSRRGRFDPNLPSVNGSSNSNAINNEFATKESSLTAVLADHKHVSTPPKPADKTLNFSTRSKQRVNSKTDDPHYEVTEEAARELEIRTGAFSMNLRRSDSQQSLLTDFFRLTRVAPSSKRDASEDLRTPASEADITAFLSFKIDQDSGRDVVQRNQGRSLASNDDQHFEEIAL